jgi:hypothetical protein
MIAMKGFAEGTQLHCARDIQKDLEFEYTFDAPQDGIYVLAASVVTVHMNQKLLLAVNDAEEQVEIALPYTVGRWGQTEPVEVSLTRGRNVLHFTRPAPGHGMTIKDFTLKLQR